ncbi:hypothetical protein ABZ990_30430 [Streptomyces sp. NPDC046203]|uniref:hypothetical protein n=1 Tax=Streptomyces sp. NPDC046203 TaxID=3154602 RepID=UPI0033C0AF5E
MVPPPGTATGAARPHLVPAPSPGDLECVALAEIELCGELIIAASAADGEERLSADRIDEVLRVGAHGR